MPPADPVSVSAQRSLPALRQLTPDSAAFIQQSQQQQPPAPQATTALTAVVLSSSVQRTAGKTAATVTSALQPPVISLTQPTQVGIGKQGQPTPLVCRRQPLALLVCLPRLGAACGTTRGVSFRGQLSARRSNSSLCGMK